MIRIAWVFVRSLLAALLLLTATMKVFDAAKIIGSGGLLASPLCLSLAVGFEIFAAIVVAMTPSRIAHRLWKQGGEAEGWGFFSASIGGNTWAVTRENGQSDLLTLSEIRLFGGYEVLRPGGRGYVIEAGLALGRKIEYERPLINVSLNNGVFIQAGWQF